MSTRVAILRGGPSEEFDVSLKTGEAVIRALEDSHYVTRDIVITRDGEWLLHGRSRDPHEVLAGVDVVFNALHGAYGEDGTVQRLLERFGVPFTGSSSYAAALAMNKAIAKDHLRHHRIAMPRHFVVNRESRSTLDRVVQTINHLFGSRFMVKPVNGGSSIGAVRADNEHMLMLALVRALEKYEQVIVEEWIDGREVTCGVIEGFRNTPLYALPSIEIVHPENRFFDYEAKYSGTTTEIVPSPFNLETKRRIEEIAKTVHTTLGLSQYSRSDMIVGKDGHIYFLEVNTLPGLTSESLIPKALSAIGAPYRVLIEHLLTDALERSTRRVR